MKTFKIIGVLFFIFVFFVIPVSAFEDDFNDADITDWNIISGTWYAKNTSSQEGSNDYYINNHLHNTGPSTITAEISKTASDFSYIEFDIRPYSVINLNGGSSGNIDTYSRIYFSDTDYIDFHNKDTDVQQIEISGFSYTPVAYTPDEWYHVEITFYVNGNIKVDVYHDGTIHDTQTTTYTHTNDGTIKLYNRIVNNLFKAGSYATTSPCIDNIFTGAVSDDVVNGIEWDLDQYIEGETASYSWNLQNSFWQDLIYKYRVQISKDGAEIDTVKVSQTGTRYQEVDTPGTYEVKLQYSGLIFTNWISTDSDSVNVIPQVDSYINVPSTSAIKTNFTATYLYGSTPISPIINIKELQNDYTYKVIDTKILPAATAGTTYTTNLSISTVGYYVVDLYDNGQGKSYATDTIQTNYVYVPPFDAVLSSYIDTSMTNYSFGGVISGSYVIEDTNYTDYHTRVEIYNVDKDIISFAYEPLHQIDTFDIPVTDFLFYNDGENVYVVNTNFLSGNNRVQLSAYNTDGSLNEVIAHKNITISATDEEGYGLSLSKYTVVENEVFAIKAITPVQASIIISPLTLMGVSDTTILINGSTQLSHALGMEDTYRISLVSSGETKSSVIITVLEGEEIIPPTEEEEDEVTQSTIEMVIMFLSMPAFWGMIIWVGVVGGAAQSNAVNRSSTGYIAFALGNILAIVGMFAPYTMYVLVILWIGAGVFFKLGREAAGSEEY